MKLKIKDYLFVGVQFFLFFLYLFDVTITTINLSLFVRYVFLTFSIVGLVVLILALLQLNKNLSPFPTPKSSAELIQVGLYKYIRHPIYTGILLMLFGYGFYLNSSFKIAISIILLILFYFKSSYEEKQLCIKYSNYSEYTQKTGRFLPKFSK